MGDQHSPTITSFVIRFVVENEADEAMPASPLVRGSIRHVQSDQSLNFGAWRDAVDFMRRYVPLDAFKQE